MMMITTNFLDIFDAYINILKKYTYQLQFLSLYLKHPDSMLKILVLKLMIVNIIYFQDFCLTIGHFLALN